MNNVLLPPPPDARGVKIVEEFGQECHRVHAYWQMSKYLFDENPSVENLKAPHYEHFFAVIKSSLYESFILGIVRLHDNAEMSGSENLTVDYVIKRIQWDAASKRELIELSTKMISFANKLTLVRHKFTAHNDLQTILQRPVLGAFDLGEDEGYFMNLETFVSVSLGDRFLFGNFVPTDVALFMTAFNNGRIQT
jgi:hypothetical protein